MLRFPFSTALRVMQTAHALNWGCSPEAYGVEETARVMTRTDERDYAPELLRMHTRSHIGSLV